MLSVDESDSLDDESDDDGSESRSIGTCAFTFRFEYSIGRVDKSVGRVDNSNGRVRGVGSGVFVPIGIESIGGVVLSVVFVPIGVEFKGGQFIEIFGAQSPDFPSNYEYQFYSYSLVLTLL